jgi:hypothetical protein
VSAEPEPGYIDLVDMMRRIAREEIQKHQDQLDQLDYERRMGQDL